MPRSGRSVRLSPRFWRGSTTFLTFLGEANLQAVATSTQEAQLLANAESELVAVATATFDGQRIVGGDALLQGVADLEAVFEVADAEAILQATATMFFDPSHIQRRIRWQKKGRDGVLRPGQIPPKRKRAKGPVDLRTKIENAYR